MEIVTSGLSLVEVCKHPGLIQSDKDTVAAYFENDYIIIVPLDKNVGTHARGLMMTKIPKLKPPDAAHLSTALISNSDEFHTFDGDLLDLDGKLAKADGTILKICRPGFGGPSLPLLDAAKLAGEAVVEPVTATQPPIPVPVPSPTPSPAPAQTDEISDESKPKAVNGEAKSGATTGALPTDGP